jgi:hypothetical protein
MVVEAPSGIGIVRVATKKLGCARPEWNQPANLDLSEGSGNDQPHDGVNQFIHLSVQSPPSLLQGRGKASIRVCEVCPSLKNAQTRGFSQS